MTLRAPVYTPYYRPDWTRAVNASSQGLNPNLFGGGIEPFYQTDWPNPRGYPFPAQNRTWLWTGNALLLGNGVAPSPPPGQWDWPNPRGPVFPVLNRSFVSVGNALIGGGLAPVTTVFDYPNPRGYLFPGENRTWLQGLNVNLLGGGLKPFAQTDWQNPRGPIFPIQNRTFIASGRPSSFQPAWVGPSNIVISGGYAT